MRFPYQWRLSDGYAKGNGRKAFTVFAGGGGSSMGLKLAGFEVLGCCEIDKDMFALYEKNHHPKHAYNLDIRSFKELCSSLPGDLLNLDILDGSPPCTSFSTSGKREETWGQSKRFREGQAEQVLDDLFFEFIDLADRLRPKVILAENVKGMLLGNARGYVKEIVRKLDEIGYDAQVFELDASGMGVPQKRVRMFVVARRKDLGLSPLSLSFNEAPITYGHIRQKGSQGYRDPTRFDLRVWDLRRPGDRTYADVLARFRNGSKSSFSAKFVYDDQVMNTVDASEATRLVCVAEKRFVSERELILAGTFPVDYDFGRVGARYVIGMSVPPVMMAQIASAIYRAWFRNDKDTAVRRRP